MSFAASNRKKNASSSGSVSARVSSAARGTLRSSNSSVGGLVSARGGEDDGDDCGLAAGRAASVTKDSPLASARAIPTLRGGGGGAGALRTQADAEFGSKEQVPIAPSRRRAASPVAQERTPPPSPPKATFTEGERKESKDVAIKVVARVRPRLPHEEDHPMGVFHPIPGLDDPGCLQILNDREHKQFTVDEVIDSRHGKGEQGSQAAVFDRVGRDLVAASIKGFNVCIFAYGHTGSGKTYTMLGPTPSVHIDGEHQGLLPRFIRELFRSHAKESVHLSTRYTCEFYEVYNEQIRDLLAPSRASRTKKVHVHPKHGVRIENLCQSVVGSPEEALLLVNFGMQMRTVAATTMNDRSSRSHAIFTFKYERESVGKDLPSQRSAATFVDLAGREDQEASTNSDLQFREMCYINISLFHLSTLIKKLSEGQVQKGTLADFRNSKLTLLLSQALVGNSRTLLLATVSPLQSFFEDSASTLHFAQAAKKIQTKPMINVKTGVAVVKELEGELDRLRKDLKEAKTGETEKEQELMAAQALIAHYKTSFEDILSQSEEKAHLRKQISQQLGLPDVSLIRSRHPKMPSGQLIPFFTKLSDDDALQACCNYCLCRGAGETLNSGRLRVGSDEASNDIVLHGIGIRPHMCEIRFQAPSEVVVELSPSDSGEEPRVLVSGKPVTPEEPLNMNNGDSIIFGYAHAFRLILPPLDYTAEADAKKAETAELAQQLAPSLDMQSALRDVQDGNSRTFKKMAPVMQQMSTTAQEAFLTATHTVSPLIDEANIISKEVLGPETSVSFELLALADFLEEENCNPMPALVVVVTQRQNSVTQYKTGGTLGIQEAKVNAKEKDSAIFPATGLARCQDLSRLTGKAKHPMVDALGLGRHMQRQGDSLLYVWSLEKFLRRLKEMRELYQEGDDVENGFALIRHRLQAKPYLSPWREMTLRDKQWIEEDYERARRLRHDRRNSESLEETRQSKEPMSLAEVALAAYCNEEASSRPLLQHRPAEPKDKAIGISRSGPAAASTSRKNNFMVGGGGGVMFPSSSAAHYPPGSAIGDQVDPKVAATASSAAASSVDLAEHVLISPRLSPEVAAVVSGLAAATASASAPSSAATAPQAARAGTAGSPVPQPTVHSQLMPLATSNGRETGKSGFPIAIPSASMVASIGLLGSNRSGSVSIGLASAEPSAGAPSADSSRLPSPRRIGDVGGVTGGSALHWDQCGVNLNSVGSSGALRSPQGIAGKVTDRADARGSPLMTRRLLERGNRGDVLAARSSRSPTPSERGDSTVARASSPDVAASLVRRDIEKLRSEISLCRADRGNHSSEQDRLGSLLDRFEGLLANLAKASSILDPAAIPKFEAPRQGSRHSSRPGSPALPTPRFEVPSAVPAAPLVPVTSSASGSLLVAAPPMRAASPEAVGRQMQSTVQVPALRPRQIVPSVAWGSQGIQPGAQCVSGTVYVSDANGKSRFLTPRTSISSRHPSAPVVSGNVQGVMSASSSLTAPSTSSRTLAEPSTLRPPQRASEPIAQPLWRSPPFGERARSGSPSLPVAPLASASGVSFDPQRAQPTPSRPTPPETPRIQRK